MTDSDLQYGYTCEGRRAPKVPLYVSAECLHCEETIIRYRWEDDKGFIHANGGKRECRTRTVATPKPEVADV